MKYYDKIGFWKNDVEIRPGVYRSEVIEKYYAGDVLENRLHWDPAQTQNDDLNINNKISIIADPYLNDNLGSIKYATFMGVKWKVRNLDIKYPRVIFDLGGVYNGVDA